MTIPAKRAFGILLLWLGLLPLLAGAAAAATPVITSPSTASGTLGSAFSYQITASNSPASYYAINLPAGLTVNVVTGLISGTPTVASAIPFTITITATNASGTGAGTLSLTIAGGGAPTITSPSTASGYSGSPFSYQITATNGPTSFNATGLPTGVSINSATGLISGTPTSSSVSPYNVTLSATNGSGTFTAPLTLEISQDPTIPVITSPLTASGAVGSAFSYQITATHSPTTFLAKGLPSGLSVNSATGLISGTPTAGGTFTVTIGAAGVSLFGGAYLVLTIAGAPGAPVITNAGNIQVISGLPFFNYIAATNGPTSYNATGLPAGLSINTATGLISGAASTSGTFTVLLSATNASGIGEGTTILAFGATPLINPSGQSFSTVGATLSYQIDILMNGASSYNAFGMPPGISVNTATGILSGPITTKGLFNMTVSATNGAGTSELQVVASLVNNGAPSATVPVTRNGSVGSAFSYQITPTATSCGAYGLPAGISVNTMTGLISGIPTMSGSFNAVSFTSNVDGTAGGPLGLTITGPGGSPVINSDPVAAGARGSAFSYQITSGYNPAGFNAVGLPPGLSINTATGQITGTPTASGSYPVLISATNPSGTGGETLALYITGSGGDPFITSATNATGSVGTSFSYLITATNGPTSYNAIGLPAGLSINTATGQISGTPTTSGSFYAVITATNASGTRGAPLVILITGSGGLPPVITSPLTASGTLGSAFSYQITASNSPTFFNATGLPAGLSINTASGRISGTPTASGAFAVNLSATNTFGTGTANLALTIVAPPVITSPLTANATLGSAFSYQITATNSPTSFNATGLPAGLSINTATGLISGTPTAAGTSTVSLSATNSAGTGTASLTLTVVASPAITSPLTANGVLGSAFSYQITASNGPTSFNATGLPAGLSVNTATGLITGTPTASGSFTVALSATNANGTGTANLALSILGPPVITSPLTASGTLGSAFSYQITASSSPTSFNATGLPAGLSVNTATGLISGTPTATGSSTVTLSATNAAGTGNASLTLTITARPAITSPLTANGVIATAFSYQITASNGPTSFNATGLPAGLSVNTATGLISGTPTVIGSFTVTLSATNASGTGTASLALTISGPPVITSTLSTFGVIATPFTYQITATNSPTSFNATGLPLGLSIDTATGLISGTPTSAGSFTVGLSATNGTGTGTANLALTIYLTPPASTAPGLNAAIVYPNPVVPPYSPVIRVCPGIVDSINVSIFDISGHVVNSSSQFSGPTIAATGEGAGQYCYEYTWSGHVPSGVYFAVVHAHGSGSTVKARIKFAVVR